MTTKITNENDNSNNKSIFDLSFDSSKLVSLIFAGIAISIVLLLVLQAIPNALSQTQEAKSKRQQSEAASKSAKEENDIKTKIEEENRSLSFVNRRASLELEGYGKLNITFLDQISPKNTENYIRLINRGTYNNTTINRLYKDKNSGAFSVLQGGNYDRAGGKSADLKPVPDEQWKVKPEVDKGKIINQPELKDASVYTEYNPENGRVTYKKGTVLAAKNDTNGSVQSEFMIMLGDSKLGAENTVIGKIDEADFAILDKMNAEIDYIPQTDEKSGQSFAYGDLTKELKLKEFVLLK